MFSFVAMRSDRRLFRDQRSIPIWARTLGGGPYVLQNVPGGFSASDWENMIQQAAVIYREESGAMT